MAQTDHFRCRCRNDRWRGRTQCRWGEETSECLCHDGLRFAGPNRMQTGRKSTIDIPLTAADIQPSRR
jgi:hypothetical protein